MPSCVIKLCRNFKNKRKSNNTVTFHVFPTDPVLSERWIKEVRSSRNEYWWKPNPHSTICSAHFLNKDKYVTKGGRRYIKRDAIPSRGLFLSKIDSDSDKENNTNNVKHKSTIDAINHDHTYHGTHLGDESKSTALRFCVSINGKQFRRNFIFPSDCQRIYSKSEYQNRKEENIYRKRQKQKDNAKSATRLLPTQPAGKIGMSLQIIESSLLEGRRKFNILPAMLYCVVCQDLIDDNALDGNYPWTLQCGHIFHKNCIPEELLGYNCPQCRGPATSSFRLYPSIEHRDHTISLLRSCVEAMQELYLQQKSLAEQKEEVIKTLTTQNEQCQSKVLELQGTYLTYTNEHDGQIKGFNDEINKITEEKERLMGEITTHKEEMGQHAVTFQTLQDKLKRQRDLFQAMNELKQESEDLLNGIVETFNERTANVDQSPETPNENIEDTNSRNDSAVVLEETNEN